MQSISSLSISCSRMLVAASAKRIYRTSFSSLASDDLRNQLLTAALDQVPKYGWTDDALVAGSINHMNSKTNKNSVAALSGMISVHELITFAMSQWNDQLKQELSAKVRRNGVDDETDDDVSESAPKTNDIIINAMRIRLSYLKFLIQSQRWHEGMVVGLHPTQIWTTQTQLRELIEIICQALPNVVSLSPVEKIGLGAVYVATELHMLNCKSDESFEETWQFLRERINDWDTIRQQPLPLSFLQNTVLSSVNSSPLNLKSIPIVASDALFVFSQVTSSLATGALSLVYPNQVSDLESSTVLNILGTTLQKVSDTVTPRGGKHNNGTDPSHYDIPKSP